MQGEGFVLHLPRSTPRSYSLPRHRPARSRTSPCRRSGSRGCAASRGPPARSGPPPRVVYGPCPDPEAERNREVVPTVWGVNYSGEERRPAAGEGGGGTPAFWTSWRLPPGCRPPRTSPAACRGRPGSSGWWSPWGCGDKEDDVILTPGRGRGMPPPSPPVPHRPVHFTSLVPAAVLSERGTVLLLPLEDKTPPRG